MQASNDIRPSIGRLLLGHATGSIGAGKYRVFASLGRGGMADVQLAAAQGPKGFTKLAVVKRLRPLLADDPAAVNMFLDEARLDARLNHPNVIQTYEFGEEHGSYFIVMEYLDGQSLHELLQALRPSGKSPPPSLWAKIVADALAGLHYAHELRDYDGAPLHVVHRDVSPQNIVVTYEGRVKLVDFGIAKATLNLTKTESQIIKGKLAYMAPEQAEPSDGRQLDRRADVFAMGIVLWECLTQKRLVTGDVRTVLSKIIDMEFRAPSLLNPEVPPELDAITKRALERAPEDRYPTALAMREALEKYLRTSGEFVGDAEIGGLVAGLFEKERADIQRQIRAHMTGIVSEPALAVARAPKPGGSAPEIAAPDAAAPAAAAGMPPGLSPTDSVGSLRAVRTSSLHPLRIEARSSRAMRFGVSIAALVFLGIVALATRSAPPLASPRSAARPAASIQLIVRVSPADAIIAVDGESVPNPFTGSFPRDAREHRIEATRAGYVATTKVVRFDHDDMAFDVALDKLPAAPVTTPSAAPPKAPAPPPGAAKPATRAPRSQTQPSLDDDPWR